MRSIKPLLSLLLLSEVYQYAQAIELTPRRQAGNASVKFALKEKPCALLKNKLYCYGGYILGSTAGDTLSSLDLFANSSGPVQNLIGQWNTVTPSNPSNIILGRRGFGQNVAIPERDRLIINGGYNYINATYPQQNIAYNAATNTWESLANYNDPRNGGNRQIYYGTGVNIPSLNLIGFYGGYQQHVTLGSDFITPVGTAISGLTFNNSDGYSNSYAGYYYMTFYNIGTDSWSVPSQLSVPLDYHINFDGTYHPGTKKIYYVGGSFHNVTAGSLYNSYLSYATTFDTNNGQWTYEPINGPPPPQRFGHTVTLLPNGQDILVYGGTVTGSTALTDYCYTLNVPTMTWRYHNLVAPVGFSGPRYYHSAVLADNSSLFILFGSDRDGQYTSDMAVLDVRDINNLSFVNNFPFDNASNSSSSNNNGTQPSAKEPGSKGLSTGAIAGIAVGGVVAGGLIVFALVCCLRRKKEKKTPKGNSTANYEQQKNNDNEVLEVDWDKIDNHYKEINMLPLHQQPQYHQSKHEFDSSIDPRPASPSYPDFSVAGSDQRTAVSPDLDSNITDWKPHQHDHLDGPNSNGRATFSKPDGHIPMMHAVKPDGAGHT